MNYVAPFFRFKEVHSLIGQEPCQKVRSLADLPTVEFTAWL